MIKFKNIKTIWSLFIGALLLVACESSDTEVEKDFEEVNQVEDLLSTADTSNETEPLLTMHFDADLSEEEVKIEFEKAVESYLSSQPSYASKSEGFSAEWYTQLYVWTGRGTDEGTDGSARTSLWFDTSAGRHRTAVDLDNGNTNERQGGIDAYLIRSSIENTPVETVSITNAFLYLTGTDNWFVTYYNAYVLPRYQTTESTGASWLTMEPNVWLVSDTATGSDFYHTGRETGYSGNGLEFVGEEGEFISYQIEGEAEVTFTENFFLQYNNVDGFPNLDIVAEDYDFYMYAWLENWEALPVGVYSSDERYPDFVFALPGQRANPLQFADVNPLEVTITNAGEVGEFVDMTFSGEFTDINGDTKTVTGEIHVIRDEDDPLFYNR